MSIFVNGALLNPISVDLTFFAFNLGDSFIDNLKFQLRYLELQIFEYGILAA